MKTTAGSSLLVTVLVAALGIGATACEDDTSNTGGAGPGGNGGEGAQGGNGAQGAQGGGGSGGVGVGTNRIDILLMVDNSRSMADKQQILSLAVPDLVGGLVNPACVDEAGMVVAQPAQPTDECPAGSSRLFKPTTDMHVGIISSSLGAHGADACPNMVSCTGGTNTTLNDKGHLLSRADACTQQPVATWDGKGFLAWDPLALQTPPGETNAGALVATLSDMVNGVGQIGCGYESQLESWFRFLADPNPYESIVNTGIDVEKQGTDSTLLQQRADFLRSDSTLLILMLTDENDCSIIEDGQYYLAAQIQNGGSPFHLPRARQECVNDPNDPCCKSCAQTPGNCPADPTCGDGIEIEMLTALEDNISLRCFEQKRRFGIDFLYPVDRYANALTRATFDPTSYSLEGSAQVANPIYSDLSGAGGEVRGTDKVFLAGIVGVPWQLIANDVADPGKGFKLGPEIPWDAVLGDPAVYVPATDPHMVESIDQRAGLPTSGNTDPIHGHDYAIPQRDDLQYACTFPLQTPRDCTDPTQVAAGCDCDEPGNDNPLCEGPNNQLQSRAKAYPGLRHLSVIKKIGAQGVAGSICAADTSDPSSAAFGYRPAISTILRAVAPSLVKP